MTATQKIVEAAKDFRAKRITGDEFRSVMKELRESMPALEFERAKLSATRYI